MGKKHKHSILMLHGLGGSPAEMAYMQMYLEHKGFNVCTPSLPGHGTHYSNLKTLELKQLTSFCQTAFEDLKRDSEKVSVMGLCLGAVLTLKLAIDNPGQIDSIMPISTTLFFDGWGLPAIAKFLPILKYTPAYFLCNVEESEPYGVKNAQIRKWLVNSLSANSKVHYSKIPLKSIFMMRQLVASVKLRLGDIKCKTLAVHAIEDEVCSLANLDFLQARIAGGLFSKLILNNSYHLATIDSERSLIAKEASNFLCGNLGKSNQGSKLAIDQSLDSELDVAA